MRTFENCEIRQKLLDSGNWNDTTKNENGTCRGFKGICWNAKKYIDKGEKVPDMTIEYCKNCEIWEGNNVR